MFFVILYLSIVVKILRDKLIDQENVLSELLGLINKRMNQHYVLLSRVCKGMIKL